MPFSDAALSEMRCHCLIKKQQSIFQMYARPSSRPGEGKQRELKISASPCLWISFPFTSVFFIPLSNCQHRTLKTLRQMYANNMEKTFGR